MRTLIFERSVSAINNAIALVSPEVTYLGSILIFLVWMSVEFTLRKMAVKWVTDDGQVVKVARLSARSRLALVGCIVLLWVPRFFSPAPRGSLSNLTPTPRTIQNAQPDEVLIVVTEFKNDSHLKYDIAGSVAEIAVAEGLKRCPYLSIPHASIRLERADQTFGRDQLEEVKLFGRNYGATMVIWGYYDDAGIFPYFTVIPEKTVNLTGYPMPPDPLVFPQPASPAPHMENRISPFQPLGFYVHRDVPRLMTYLTEFTLGEFFFLRGDGCAAEAYRNVSIGLRQLATEFTELAAPFRCPVSAD